MRTYILVSEKSWHNDLFCRLKKDIEANWIKIATRENFNKEYLKELSPDKIFIPHWSYIIKPDIYEQFECIVFHMTDLPYGRGGTPLQNLIVRGFDKTVMSAIKVTKGIDTGDVYLKRNLSLDGKAQEIFIRATDLIEQMIKEIINNDIFPVPQVGDVVIFNRRTAKDGNLQHITDIKKIYDYIRMLDADGYPNAFLETDYFKFEFMDAVLSGETVLANVRISKK